MTGKFAFIFSVYALLFGEECCDLVTLGSCFGTGSLVYIGNQQKQLARHPALGAMKHRLSILPN
jgi:hypothetical protein